MKDMITVIKFTIREMVKRKSFIVSTLIILAMIVIGFNIPNIIKSFKGGNEIEKIIIQDKDNVFEDRLKEEDIYGYKITLSNESKSKIKDEINNGDYDSAIIISRVDDIVSMTYITENTAFNDGVSDEFTDYLMNLYKDIRYDAIELDDSQKKFINPEFDLSIESSSKEAQGNVLIMMFMSVVLFYAINFCASQVSSSITTEKTSKIIETLATSTTPKNIVLGKTIGVGIVGVFQVLLIILTAYISANIFIEKEVLSSFLDMSTLTLPLLLITLIYFILGYLTFSLLYALTGSTVSKPEDIQSANSPVMMITILGFYLSYFTMMNPTSNLNKFASLFPFSSPFCMPFRIMMKLHTPSMVIISMLILIITIIIIGRVSIKIYSNAILNYGSKMSFKDIIKLYRQK